MTEDYSSLNIFQKLAKVQRAVDILQKDSSGYGYRYVSEEQLLPMINAEIDKLGLTLYPGIVPDTLVVKPYTYQKKAKKGDGMETVNEFYVQADTTYTWVNNDNPSEVITVPWALVGDQTDSSQAFGSGLTYSERYFLLKFFHCATTNDDPDKIRSDQADRKDKNDLGETLRMVNDLVQHVVAKNPDEAKNIEEMVTRYVDKRTPDGKLVRTRNYNEIKKKAKAMALLAELNKKYGEDVQ